MSKISALITIKNSFINDGIGKIISGIREYSDFVEIFDMNEIDSEKAKKIVRDFQILIFDDYVLNIDYLTPQSKNFLIESWKSIEIYREVVDILLDGKKKILWLSHHDLHESYIVDSAREIESKNLFDHIIWFYEHQNIGKKNIKTRYVDEWMERYDDPINKKNEILHNFRSRIDLPFCIKNNEVIEKKDKDVIVPGVPYRTRKIAMNSLKKSNYGLRISNYSHSEKILTSMLFIIQKLPYSLAKQMVKMLKNMRIRNYKKEIRRSRICWIDGSGYGYPVHKFFEAIEEKTLIISPGLTGLKEYGFLPGVHYIESAPEEFGEIAYRLISSENFLIDTLTNNALELAQKSHSVEKRVEQLDTCIRAIFENKFQTGIFIDGKFEVFCS